MLTWKCICVKCIAYLTDGSRVNRCPHKTQSSFALVSYPTKAVSSLHLVLSQVKMDEGSVELISLTPRTFPLRRLLTSWREYTCNILAGDNFQ